MLAVTTIIAALATLAVPRIGDSIERAKVAKAIGDIEALETDIDSQDSLPPNLAAIGRDQLLDPWGNPYVYNPFPPKAHGVPQGARRDRFLVPINSTYDLYSTGADGASVSPLTAKASLDDVIRANDGGYIGLASRY